ncbi:MULTISPECIES: cation-translocating P-type ATPase [unclassified Streptomyces]|uniref:cation-translocating P-type ATPase n=1 Tax=unclassified Streptomyces TaxID=2593676 RepID=UPI00037E6EBF|nr:MULTISPECIES: cation-translocating P-type ATPase [unclassified Streptomyces]MYT29330.1 HAD-IC family P-type ATPase [Streptomyces sp. SID8354]
MTDPAQTEVEQPEPGGSRAADRSGREAARRGLTTAEVAERVARGDVNDVPVRSSRSTADIIRGNVFTRFNAIIGVLFVIILIVGPLQDGLFGFVIIANTGIGILQELRAKKTLDSLALIGEARPTVRRDGTAVELPTSEVVLDDVIELGPGGKVIVDGEVLESDGLEVDESLLTGEADPVVKKPGDAVMSGSFVVAGGGAFAATKVGRAAYAAQLAEEASRFTLVHSELRTGISRILKYVTWMMVPTALGLILSHLLTLGLPADAAVRRMVAGIVPMIPEGLVLLTSVAFAIGVVRLGRRQCLVQELPAIEGLARVDVVCLDKTGTLTEGGMDVGEVRPLDGQDPDRVRQVLGAFGASDPRPNASLQAVVDACPAPDSWRCTDTLPFSSARKYSGAAFEEPGGERSSWLLGAPDVLLPDGDPLLPEIDRRNAQGLRVLLLARAARPLDHPDVAREGRPTALVVLEQRLRPDAPETLRYFAEQGVQAKVISGDNAVSVGAVAGKLGLPGADAPVDARQLPHDDPEAMAKALEEGAVFGRVTPQQKREMVGALQARGHHVAMTGDGVNDVLALKDADIGVAMGAGSEATRAVAQIVLLNNSFATLPSVVAEGRRVIGNITRVATLFLTKTVYSVLLAILVACCQIPYPYLPRHLTLLSTLTIGVPAFFLALAPNKERARPHFVRRVMRYAVPSGLITGLAAFATYLLARVHYTGPDALAAQTSAATLTLFLTALYVLAIIARPYTWWRIGLVLLMGLGFLIVLVTPWLQHFFELRLVGTTMPWAAVAIAAVAALLLETAWRWVGRRFPA